MFTLKCNSEQKKRLIKEGVTLASIIAAVGSFYGYKWWKKRGRGLEDGNGNGGGQEDDVIVESDDERDDDERSKVFAKAKKVKKRHTELQALYMNQSRSMSEKEINKIDGLMDKYLQEMDLKKKSELLNQIEQNLKKEE